MTDNEVAIAIIGIIFGSVVAIVFISMLISLIKTWINRKKGSYSEEKFDRLAKAFINYKKESERRLQNLEAIISEEDPPAAHDKKQLKETQLHNTIEIESHDSKQEQKKSDSGNLQNMLKK